MTLTDQEIEEGIRPYSIREKIVIYVCSTILLGTMIYAAHKREEELELKHQQEIQNQINERNESNQRYEELNRKRMKNRFKEQYQDLNHNGIDEIFYQIGDKKAFLSIDGKSLEDSLSR